MIIFTLFFVLCVINVEAAIEGDSCIKKGYPGVCTAIKQCPDALLDIENRVRPQICGFGFTTLVVCCISSGQAASQPATTTAAPPAAITDKLQKGNCILPPYPDHGSYVASVPNGKPGDAFDVFIITVSCRRGYDVQGSRTVVCQDGSWPEPMPRCLRACYLEAHPSVEYTCMATEGENNVSRICREWEFHGVIASPRCRAPLYKSTTALMPMKCISGSWDYLATSEPGLRVSCKEKYVKDDGDQNFIKPYINMNDKTLNHVVVRNGSDDLSFEMHLAVKSNADAQILLTPIPYTPKDLIHTKFSVAFISDNTKLFILNSNNHGLEKNINTPNIISGTSFTAIYVKISNGTLEVGRRGSSAPILSYSHAALNAVRYFSFGSHKGEATFLYDCPAFYPICL